MCSQQSSTALVSTYGLKVPNPTASPFVFHPSMTQAAFDFHRAQIYDYNARLHFGLRAAAYPGTGALNPYHPHAHDPLAHFYQSKYDPRARFVHEEPKPSHSYIGLIAMAILDSKETKLVLADIYQWILDNYSYFRNRGPGWRNSIRHNLSLNDCFIKAGRSANGKGHYWAIHPANVDDFKKGDFRRRKAQRKVRRHMGLSVPDDEDSPSPPPPNSAPDASDWAAKVIAHENSAASENSGVLSGANNNSTNSTTASPPLTSPNNDVVTPGSLNRSLDSTSLSPSPGSLIQGQIHRREGAGAVMITPGANSVSSSSSSSPPPPSPFGRGLHCTSGKKRLFDVESLLAPESPASRHPSHHISLPSPFQRHHHQSHHLPHHLAHRDDFVLTGNPAKIQKTSSLGVMTSPDMTPNHHRLPRLALDEINAESKRDQDLDDDENIDVEETEDDVEEEGGGGERGAKTEGGGLDGNENKKTNDISIISSSQFPPSPRGDTNPKRLPLMSSSPLTSGTPSPQQNLGQQDDAEGNRKSPVNLPRSSPHSNVPKYDKDVVLIKTPGQGALALHTRGWTGPTTSVAGVTSVGWKEGRPSAFHSASSVSVSGGGGVIVPTTLQAWSGGINPHGFPLVTSTFPLPNPGNSTAEALAAQQRWQETFTRMMTQQRQLDSQHDVKSEA